MEDEKETLAHDPEMDIPLAHLADFNPDGNPKLVHTEWAQKMEEGKLEIVDFKEHWRKFVPKYYSLDPGSNEWSLEADKSNEVLIEVLERFIAAGDFEEEVKKLKERDRPPSVCGRVFKMGEPTYSCRECGMDSTCVLCVGCFKQSPHRNHNYKMGTSAGGGFCDCGDVEAWKTGPYCDTHLAGTQVTEDRPSVMPVEMAARCSVAFTAILRYAYQILTLKHSPRLPHDLRSDEKLGMDSDVYCTVLYNDEIHTFEQVIGVLTKIVKCSQKDSMEYVTNIDREGRAVVRCAMFQQCQTLKADIERFTTRHGGQSLRVDVVHTHVIAHQVFAMRLLRWLQLVMMHSESFRNIFTEVALKIPHPETSIMEGILLRDSSLWKSARTHWHRLFISGMLMEYSSKKALAKVFTKNYGTVLKDFIRDDHDHSFSIASLSVQIFTVPTLALHLIAHEEVLFVLLNTFLSECTSKLNKDNKLQFERNGASSAFKRSQYILYDLRYLLSTVPTQEQWTDALRRGFLQGLQLFIQLMGYMEGMDAALRQTAQHMEFEPEWESAFNLHIKLAHVITMLVEWCGSDKVVLVKAFRSALRDLANIDKTINYQLRELADHSASCVIYDVATQPVSIHLPLSRFFAGLYLHLDKYGLTFDSPEFLAAQKPTAVQIMETVLRTQVMIGQVHAGMWRRNGYSILNQLYFYQNVRCRSEMLDRDVVMMQIGASLIESDAFLIHVINKYGLMAWADPNYEDNAEEEGMRQTISLVEEMLGLLVNLMGERFTPGVGAITPDQKIEKEIMQQLCIRPLSHSELNKTLPDDANHETGLERVIEKVAVFKKPENGGKGVYELKAELYEQYNVFYYHYTREELSKSEEAQRKRRKAAGQLECCPAPQLPQLAPPFESLPNLLQCDVMMHILQTVLSRAANLRARSYSEHQLQKALHLIGYGLNEEQSQRYPYLRFAEKSEKWNIEKLVVQLSTSQRVESHKDMLLWVLERFKRTKAETASPVSAPVANNDAFKEWRAKMAAEKRAKIMAQMTAMQKSFMVGNAHLLGAMECEGSTSTEMEEPEVPPVTHTCILCQQETAVTPDGVALVLCALVQRSTVHVTPGGKADKADEVFSKPLFRPTQLRPQLHTSTCGHVMHSTCWQTYFDNVLARENRRPYRVRPPTSFDVERQEFLCPLCECLGNVVIPMLPPMASAHTPAVQLSVDGFLEALRLVIKMKTRNAEDATTFHVPPLEEFRGVASPATADLFNPVTAPTLSSSLTDMVSHFADSAYTRGLNVNPGYNPFTPMVAWSTVYYTIHSTVAMLEDQGKGLLGPLPLRDSTCLEGLTRFGAWLPTVWTDAQDVSDQALYLLMMLLDSCSGSPCLLDWDNFGLLVPLALSLESLFGPTLPTDGPIQRHLTLIMFYADITRAFLTQTGSIDTEMETEEVEADSVLETMTLLSSKCGCELQDGSTRVWNNIKRSCLPFLRRAALFYHYLHNRSSGGELEEPGGDTFENLCRYLRLPSSPDELLRAPEFVELASTWASHSRVPGYITCGGVRPRTTLSLVPLPVDYSELINMVSTFTCPNSERDDSRNPTMCLVCGEILCSQSYCCQQELNKQSVGACTYHAHRCGAGVGIFLRVRECEILMLATQSRGCFTTAPYLDRYGETDQLLRRGNPLTLCQDKYERLKRGWLGHHLYEEIARAVEGSTSLMSTPWQHL